MFITSGKTPGKIGGQKSVSFINKIIHVVDCLASYLGGGRGKYVCRLQEGGNAYSKEKI